MFKISYNCTFAGILHHLVWVQLAWRYLGITFQCFTIVCWQKVIYLGLLPEKRVCQILFI